jgi:arsenite methyltransferase
MTLSETPLLECDKPVLIFGGPYSNLQATEAVLAQARRLKIKKSRIICTGDLAAYCGDAVATIDLVRESGIHVVMGNCDEQLASGAGDCGCGFPSDSLCEQLSSAWFTHANSVVRPDQRSWLAALPRRIDLHIGGHRLAVVHGSVGVMNRFVFATTPPAFKRQEIELSGCDGVIAGHCGLPFSEIVGGRLWHNAGVVGMPANDGTPRAWFSVLTPRKSGLKIEHLAVAYDQAAAATAMYKSGLPSEYRVALATGIWPSCDVLPERETQEQGVPLTAGVVSWRPEKSGGKASGKPIGPENVVLWPQILSDSRGARPIRTGQKQPLDSKSPVASACCAPAASPAIGTEEVKDYYGKTLQTSADLKTEACCTPDDMPGFVKRTLSNVHDEVLAKYYGCGLVTPAALDRARILDLGSGSGRDVYALAQLVGEKGEVVGIDMTAEQIAVARAHTEWHRERFGFEKSNVHFLDGYIEKLGDLGLEPGSFDIIVSNCVINLSTDKLAVLKGAYDLLKPGGEMYFADVYADRRLPDAVRNDPVLYGECLGGALYWNDFHTLAKRAGFLDPRLVTDRPLGVTDEKLAAKLGPAKFFSATYRLFKLPGLEPLCEDYGQAVVYKGGVANAEDVFVLDKHHAIERGKVFPVCGNTWRMLAETRFAPYFDFIGDFSRHYGIFAGCGTSMPFDGAPGARLASSLASSPASGGCC